MKIVDGHEKTAGAEDIILIMKGINLLFRAIPNSMLTDMVAETQKELQSRIKELSNEG